MARTSTTNINYYWRKNNGNLSSSTALTISGNGPYQDCLYAICNSATATASNIVLSSSSYSR